MSERTIQLTCEWCCCEWKEGDPEEDGWFSFTPEFGEQKGLQFCGIPCMLSFL